MAKPKIKIGVVGAGFASAIHIQAHLENSNLCEVAAICDRNQDKTTKYAKEYGIPGVYTDYHQLLSDPEIDLVDICLPNAAHAGLTIDAARASILSVKNRSPVISAKIWPTGRISATGFPSAACCRTSAVMSSRLNG
jgi:FlaA1/EpsC-like NDP-sugar epimerase